MDKFLFELNQIYRNNEEFWEGILCSLLHYCTAKMSGNPNPKLATGKINICFSLDTSYNCEGCEFIAANLGLVSPRYTGRLFS